jgi:raffinose/stachyose/melibiose transport system substrate-binding protein
VLSLHLLHQFTLQLFRKQGGKAMKKVVTTMLIALVMVFGLASYHVEAEQITLTVSNPWATVTDGNTIAFQRTIELFEKAYPDIELEIDAIAADYQTKLKAQIASGQAADIFMSWGAGFSKPFAQAGKLLALDEYLQDGTLNKILGGGLVNVTYDGKIYGLPTSLAIGTLYCNTELFEQAGAKIPETYSELVAAAKALRENGVTPIIAGVQSRWPGMFYYDILAIRIAGLQTCIDALNKNASFDQPRFIDAAAKLQELINMKAFNENALALSWDESVAEFNQGKAAMLFNGTWVSGVLSKDDSPVKGKIVAVRFPIVEGGQGKATEFFGGPIDCLMVNANTRYKEEAVAAVKFLAENMARESFLTGSGLPAWKIGEVDTSGLSPLLVQQADLIKDATGFVAWWDIYLEGADAQTHLNLVSDLFGGAKTPEEYAKEMQKLNE